MKKFIATSLSGLLLGTSSLLAVDLSEGWNLVAACSDVDVTSLDLTNVTEIQDTSAILYNEDYGLDGTGETLVAGAGYWFKADAATSVDLGEASDQPSVDLSAGWNLMGACIDEDVTSLNLADVAEIQSTGAILYNTDYGLDGTGESIEAGMGYWVKMNTASSSSDIMGSSETVTDEQPPMPEETDADFPSFPAL
jgi:ethanolamine utilization protein EutP (predicted NTPase)